MPKKPFFANFHDSQKAKDLYFRRYTAHLIPMGKDDVPEHIKTFYEKKKKLDMLLNTTELAHSDAYNSAAKEVLKNEEGKIDYNLLKDEDKREEFAKKMADYYVSAAQENLKSELGKGKDGKEADEFEKDILVKSYAGITYSELKKLVHENKQKYTLKAHKGISDRLVKKQSDELGPIVGNHLKEEHISDIVKHIKGLGDMVDSERMRVEDASELLDAYDEGRGAVTHDMIENKHYYKKIKKAA